MVFSYLVSLSNSHAAHQDRKQSTCWCGIWVHKLPASEIGCRYHRSRRRRTWDSDQSAGRSTTASDSRHSRQPQQQGRRRLDIDQTNGRTSYPNIFHDLLLSPISQHIVWSEI